MEVALDTLAKKRHEEQGDALTYDAAKMQVLNEAAIVCTTLSCAGYSMFSQLKQGFDTGDGSGIRRLSLALLLFSSPLLTLSAPLGSHRLPQS